MHSHVYTHTVVLVELEVFLSSKKKKKRDSKRTSCTSLKRPACWMETLSKATIHRKNATFYQVSGPDPSCCPVHSQEWLGSECLVLSYKDTTHFKYTFFPISEFTNIRSLIQYLM